ARLATSDGTLTRTSRQLKPQMDQIRQMGLTSIAGTLGVDPKTISRSLGSQVGKFFKEISGVIDTVPISQQAAKLKNITATHPRVVETFKAQGITSGSRVAPAGQFLREDLSHRLDPLIQRSKERRAAIEQERQVEAARAAAATSQAQKAEEVAARESAAAKRRKATADKRSAAASEGFLVKLTKFQAEEVRNKLDVLHDEGLPAWGRIEGTKSKPMLRVLDRKAALADIENAAEILKDQADLQAGPGPYRRVASMDKLYKAIEAHGSTESQAIAA